MAISKFTYWHKKNVATGMRWLQQKACLQAEAWPLLALLPE